MSPLFLDSAINAELKRCRKVGEKPNLGQLAREWDCSQQELIVAFGRIIREFSPSVGPLPTPADDAKEGAGIARRDDQTGLLPCPADPTLPGPSISDQVKAEAADKAERRSLARKMSGGLTPLASESIADKFRRLAAEVDAEEGEDLAEADSSDRRDRDLDRLPSPSAVLGRAKRDWPKQCADVQALAAKRGIGLGEAWRRVIKAGVDCLRAGGDGEVVA